MVTVKCQLSLIFSMAVGIVEIPVTCFFKISMACPHLPICSTCYYKKTILFSSYPMKPIVEFHNREEDSMQYKDILRQLIQEYGEKCFAFLILTTSALKS